MYQLFDFNVRAVRLVQLYKDYFSTGSSRLTSWSLTFLVPLYLLNTLLVGDFLGINSCLVIQILYNVSVQRLLNYLTVVVSAHYVTIRIKNSGVFNTIYIHGANLIVLVLKILYNLFGQYTRVWQQIEISKLFISDKVLYVSDELG